MKSRSSIFVSVVVAALFMAGCDNGEPPPSPEKTATQAPADARDVNTIISNWPEVAPRRKIGHPMMVDLADKLQVPSRVEVDEERLVRIGSYVTGRITDLYVTLGESVKTGDPSARITSPELTQAQLDYLRAASRTLLTEKAAERARRLLAADVIAMAEVERRESERESDLARAELEAAKDQLRLLGVGQWGA